MCKEVDIHPLRLTPFSRNGTVTEFLSFVGFLFHIFNFFLSTLPWMNENVLSRIINQVYPKSVPQSLCDLIKVGQTRKNCLYDNVIHLVLKCNHFDVSDVSQRNSFQVKVSVEQSSISSTSSHLSKWCICSVCSVLMMTLFVDKVFDRFLSFKLAI